MNDNNNRKNIGFPSVIEIAVIIIIVAVLLAVTIPAILASNQLHGKGSNAAKAHNLAIAAFAYSNDNHQTYPFGSSSTEIFQKLYDEKYLYDPGDVFLTQAGVNNAVITSSDTWGTEGVTVCTLAQQAWFARPSPGQVEVPLTDSEFQPAPGVKCDAKTVIGFSVCWSGH